jgi:hypothetical protein
VRRVDSEIDGQVGDALVAAGHAVGLLLDLFLYGEKVRKLLALAVQELSIFVRAVYELQNQGTSGDDARTTRKEIPAKNNSSILRVIQGIK